MPGPPWGPNDQRHQVDLPETVKELADRFGFSIRDIQRHLKTLCDLGWLKRRLGQKQYKRRYWYLRRHADPFTRPSLVRFETCLIAQGMTTSGPVLLVPGEDTRDMGASG